MARPAQILLKSRRFDARHGCSAFLGWRHGVRKLHPYHLVGLVDAEGTFFVVSKSCQPIFQLKMNLKEYPLLEAARTRLNGCGKIYPAVHDDAAYLGVACKRGLLHAVHFFHQHPLLTTKCHDFERWKRCVELYCSARHVTQVGREEIEDHIAHMNQRKKPSLLPGCLSHCIQASQVADWLSGFTSGEGSFYLERTTGYLRFSLPQAIIDRPVLDYIRDVLDAGRVYQDGKGMAKLRVCTPCELRRVQTFFKEHQLIGSKLADFEAWSDLLDLKVHKGLWQKHVEIPEPLEVYARFLWNKAARYPSGTRPKAWKDPTSRQRQPPARDLSSDPLYQLVFQAKRRRESRFPLGRSIVGAIAGESGRDGAESVRV